MWGWQLVGRPFLLRFLGLSQEGWGLAKLTKDEIVTLQVLKAKGETNQAVG